ncbi:hypothetical protein MTBBW1_1420017 [Desulfamplus magnetovallimortis]|uniref:Uncharacterized protein n=2 Tax=Desulfamplus magnetovallimortis TaxID=1246637 RepID=A0A1W1H8C2_9BACT|nr:hypothetical protein MTBBW1_1420017 [Desulfamplus magnetovallimortis]
MTATIEVFKVFLETATDGDFLINIVPHILTCYLFAGSQAYEPWYIFSENHQNRRRR